MEMLGGTGDMGVARDFCSYVDRQIAQEAPDASLQCFHGIGHGTVNSHDPAAWGDAPAMVAPALALCERAAETPDQLSRCATGVFNGIAIFMSTKQYNLSIDPADPMRICRGQKEQFQDACFISMNVVLFSHTGGDFGKAAAYVESIPDDIQAQHTIINVAAMAAAGNIDAEDYAEEIRVCRGLQSRLRLSCIAGYAYGFLEHGEPQKEYVKPLAFCQSAALTPEEARACMTYLSSYLPQWYPVEKARRVCDGVSDTGLRQVCTEGVASRT
jgi:hypothetical protein